MYLCLWCSKSFLIQFSIYSLGWGAKYVLGLVSLILLDHLYKKHKASSSNVGISSTLPRPSAHIISSPTAYYPPLCHNAGAQSGTWTCLCNRLIPSYCPFKCASWIIPFPKMLFSTNCTSVPITAVTTTKNSSSYYLKCKPAYDLQSHHHLVKSGEGVYCNYCPWQLKSTVPGSMMRLCN